MIRYNHRIAERKWKSVWFNSEETDRHYLTVLVPNAGDDLNLENARLLVYADFYRRLNQREIPSLHCLSTNELLPPQALDLGVLLQTNSASDYDLCVVPRDYLHLVDIQTTGKILACGRFLTEAPVSDFLPDYGADALRLFFLFQGPPQRDYQLDIWALGGAFRFIQRLWRMAVRIVEESPSLSLMSLQSIEQDIQVLCRDIHSRIGANKPHAALAALMGFVSEHPLLPRDALIEIVRLMEPYTPFLSAEILDLLQDV